MQRSDESRISEVWLRIAIETAPRRLAEISGIDEMLFHVFRDAPMRRIARTFRKTAGHVINGRHADSVENAERANPIPLRNHPRLVNRLNVGDFVDQQAQRKN